MSFVHSLARRRELAVLTLLAAVLVPLLVATTRPLTRLVAHFGVTWDVAALIISMITGGSWELAILFPWIIPAEVTIQGLIAVFGATYAIGW